MEDITAVVDIGGVCCCGGCYGCCGDRGRVLLWRVLRRLWREGACVVVMKVTVVAIQDGGGAWML